jgi:hypothetical protein
LEAQQILALAARFRVGVEGRQSIARIGKRREGQLGLGQRRHIAGERVEDRQLAFRIHEQLLIVLRGDVAQPTHRGREIRHRGQSTAK